MEKQFTIDEVLKLLNDLYRNPNTEGKEKASVLLGELQNSVSAWTISDQLLQINQDVESCYFAAQTMRTKIQYSFHELPPDTHMQLRDSILNHVGKVTDATPPVIATQLCLALADLSLQMTSWKNSSQELMEKFGTNPSHWHFLLELLTVLPEEVDSRALKLGENRRKEITDELKASSPVMLQLLNTVAEGGNDHQLQAKVVRCLGSWFNMYAIPPQQIAKSKLLYLLFQILTSSECSSSLHEAACDCVCSALYFAADDIGRAIQESEQLFNVDIAPGQSAIAHNQQVMNNILQGKDLSLAQNLCQGVMSLLDAYHISVATEDLDKSLNFCRIFTEMAESFLEVIVYSPNQGLGSFNTIELLLTCIGHHQYEVADITFNFWYRLSDMLYKENKDQLNEIFKPYVQRLIVALCRHCQFDSDYEGIPSRNDEFADFRERASELIKDVVFIVGSSPVFMQMFESLMKPSGSGINSWECSESTLYVMTSVARNIVPEENVVVKEVLTAVLSIQADKHLMLRYTSIQLVGELCEWIEKHPETLDPVLQFLLAGLQTKELSTIAAKSLQKICEQCRKQMVNHFDGLLQVLQAVDSFSVTNDATLELIKGTVMILCQMSPEQITQGLQQICGMQATPLMKILADKDNIKPIPGIPQRDPAVWLDRLAAVFRYCQLRSSSYGSNHPCQPVIQEVWPTLSSTCESYKADIRIIERCCRCIRYAVRCLGTASASLLSPLVTQMVSVYTQYPHSCFLYLGSILVDEYGSDKTCVPGLLQMLEAFCAPTFALLEKSSLRQHPDTLDDLFRLSLRFVQRSCLAFLESGQILSSILRLAIAATTLDHKDANASVTKFLTEFIKSSYEKPDRADFEQRSKLVRAVLSEVGQSLVTALVNASIFSLPTFMLGDIAEVIYEILQVDKQALVGWLEHAIKSLTNQNKNSVASATEQQMAEFHSTVINAPSFKDISRALRDFARLYR